MGNGGEGGGGRKGDNILIMRLQIDRKRGGIGSRYKKLTEAYDAKQDPVEFGFQL